MKKIIIRIKPDGVIEATTKGIKGPACVNIIEKLETIMKAEVVHSERTDEFFEEDSLETVEQENNTHLSGRV
ncbi:hypothetical protein MASR1M12_31440 [Erysipelotrichia bacterium]